MVDLLRSELPANVAPLPKVQTSWASQEQLVELGPRTQRLLVGRCTPFPLVFARLIMSPSEGSALIISESLIVHAARELWCLGSRWSDELQSDCAGANDHSTHHEQCALLREWAARRLCELAVQPNPASSAAAELALAGCVVRLGPQSDADTRMQSCPWHCPLRRWSGWIRWTRGRWT